MLDALACQLHLKLCRHNWCRPSVSVSDSAALIRDPVDYVICPYFITSLNIQSNV